jgi:serine phosphatase RsbU (regulator of sigma subunit)
MVKMKEELISRIPLFATLPRPEIERLAATLRPLDFPEGALLFREGTTGDLFYVLLDGQVEIIKALGTAAERVLGIRQPGSFIGEMSLFSREGMRTASVRAITPLHLLEMTRADFDALLTRQPALAYTMTRILSQRLEESENQTIQDLLEKNRLLTQAYDELKTAQAQLIEKEKLEAEMAVARTIQRSILPRSAPQLPGFDLGMRIEPMTSVGGDFFDFIPLGNGQLGLAVGDVSGHGVPAAIFMALTFSQLRAEASRTRSPRKALQAVNQHLLTLSDSGMFVSMLYGILDGATREFRYARAGHNLPVVMDAQRAVVRSESQLGQALGLFPDPALDEHSLTLPSGSLLFLYTDGVTEAVNLAGEFFQDQGLQDVLCADPWTSAQDVCDNVWKALQAYSGVSDPQDDVTLVAVCVD